MAIYVALFLCSALIAWRFTPVLRKAAVENGFLDYPDERKVHKDAVPRIGGVAIAVSFFISVMLGYVLLHQRLGESARYLTGISIGGVIVVILGLVDDLLGMNAWKKILGQTVAALALIPFGFVIRELNIPFLGVIELGTKFGIPFTIFWIVGIINTINFIDGIDGLAAGVAFIITSALFVIATVTGQLLIGLVCLVIAGSTLGFLRHNFNPASIFMGDAGSMMLGFFVATMMALFCLEGHIRWLLASGVIFALPILDTSLAVIRRLRSGKGVFVGDRSHLYDQLVDRGMSVKQVVGLFYLLSILAAVIGVTLSIVMRARHAVVVYLVLLVMAWTIFYKLGLVTPTENNHASDAGDTEPNEQ